MRLGFNTKLTIIMTIFSLLLTLIVSFVDQKRLDDRVTADREIQSSLVRDNIITAVSDIDKAYQVVEKDLEDKMKSYSITLADMYLNNPDFDSWNFDRIRRDMEGMDVYIINRDMVITHSSYKPDIGLDFTKFAPKLSDELQAILNRREFVADAMDSESNTGRVRKYSYMPTPDGQYIIELGKLLTDTELFKVIDFVEAAKRLEDKYAMVDQITVYSKDGIALGRKNEQGQALTVDQRFAPALKQVKDTLDVVTINQKENNRNIIYEFVPYTFERSGTESRYTDFRIIEIIYNQDDFNEIVQENKRIFFMQLMLMLFIALVISYVIAKVAARPMYLAFHDLLTGLPNRASFDLEIDKYLKRIRKSKSQMAVLTFDLDNFKGVNDNLGHDAGDILLKEVGRRVISVLRSKDMLARLGGDEFVVILPDMNHVNVVTDTAKRMLSELKRPIMIKGIDVVKKFHVTASIGIAIAPEHGEDPQTIYKHADIAMYSAKKSGKNTYSVFNITSKTSTRE